MTLVKKSFCSDTKSLDFWIFQVPDSRGFDSFWFNAEDILDFLGFSKPHEPLLDLASPEWKKQWCELSPECHQLTDTQTTTLSAETLFLWEPALLGIIGGWQNEKAIEFTNWVTREVLPSLRQMSESQRFANQVEVMKDAISEIDRCVAATKISLIEVMLDLVKAREEEVALTLQLKDVVQKELDKVCKE